MFPRPEPEFAKLRSDRARVYPALAKDVWWPVVKAEDLGVPLGLDGRTLFVFWQDVQTKATSD